MKKFGLIGYPLGHSFSRKYFSERFLHEGIADRFSYENYPIQNLEQLMPLLEREPTLLGFNVTIPYKVQILKLLDHLSAEAVATGAVNTVKITRNADGSVETLTGHNTDIIGFEQSLLHFLGDRRIPALILGTGGASRAVRFVLEKLSIPFLQVSRNPKDQAISYEEVSSQVLSGHPLLINTTPLGMAPDVDSLPPLPYHLINDSFMLFDLVYNPEITAFMRKGIEAGAKVKNGLEMLQLQAEAAWLIWNQDPQ